jgi:hypothetical protein
MRARRDLAAAPGAPLPDFGDAGIALALQRSLRALQAGLPVLLLGGDGYRQGGRRVRPAWQQWRQRRAVHRHQLRCDSARAGISRATLHRWINKQR